MTDEERVDRDEAAFVQASWEITKQWELTGGFREFHYDNSLQGFYGYSARYQNAATGLRTRAERLRTERPELERDAEHQLCSISLRAVHGFERRSLRQRPHGIGRLTYKIDSDHLVYATYSTGFRPGGVNRVYDTAIHAIYPPYQPDYLKNYEIGWKTQWAGNFRWNGAVFWDEWNDFQFTFLGPNSVSVVQNAPNARIKGVEGNVEWAVTSELAAHGPARRSIDAELTSELLRHDHLDVHHELPQSAERRERLADRFRRRHRRDGSAWRPAGTRLPGTSADLKLNLISRYNCSRSTTYNAVRAGCRRLSGLRRCRCCIPAFYHATCVGLQGSSIWASCRRTRLLNLAAGMRAQRHAARGARRERDQHAGTVDAASRQCTPTTCNQPYVIPVQPRTVWLQFGQKF